MKKFLLIIPLFLILGIAGAYAAGTFSYDPPPETFSYDPPAEQVTINACIDPAPYTTGQGDSIDIGQRCQDFVRTVDLAPRTVTYDPPPRDVTCPDSVCPPTTTPPPPPPSTATFHEGFAPNGTISGQSVFATASWDSPRVDDPDWNSECHPCYSRTIPDSTDGGYAMELSASDYNSSGTLQAWLHNPVLVNGSWGSKHRVDIRVKPVKWGSTAQANCSWAGGPKIFFGRPADVYETSTYTVELNICEGHAYIQKKEWGNNFCGKDPRAVDCGAGGTWYNLKTVNIAPASFGAWHTFSATDENLSDGSVRLTGYRDGVQVIQYIECAAQPCSDPLGPLPQPPLRGGREGWRSNMIDWLMDSYDVTATQ